MFPTLHAGLAIMKTPCFFAEHMRNTPKERHAESLQDIFTQVPNPYDGEDSSGKCGHEISKSSFEVCCVSKGWSQYCKQVRQKVTNTDSNFFEHDHLVFCSSLRTQSGSQNRDKTRPVPTRSKS